MSKHKVKAIKEKVTFFLKKWRDMLYKNREKCYNIKLIITKHKGGERNAGEKMDIESVR